MEQRICANKNEGMNTNDNPYEFLNLQANAMLAYSAFMDWKLWHYALQIICQGKIRPNGWIWRRITIFLIELCAIYLL